MSRWTLRSRSSWIQTLGYLPLNVMQNRLVKHKIMGKRPRFRSNGLDPMTRAIDALVRSVEPELASQKPAKPGMRSLPMLSAQVPDTLAEVGVPSASRQG